MLKENKESLKIKQNTDTNIKEKKMPEDEKKDKKDKKLEDKKMKRKRRITELGLRRGGLSVFEDADVGYVTAVLPTKLPHQVSSQQVTSSILFNSHFTSATNYIYICQVSNVFLTLERPK